jgi:MFS transporter, ACS family, D-galactonate transporter
MEDSRGLSEDRRVNNNRRWTVVALICTGILISYIDRSNLGIAAAFIMRDFHFEPHMMGILLSAFFWTYAAFQVPAGAILDRIGIRKVYAAAFLIWSLASAATALSRGMTEILVTRLVLGMAEAVGPIASLSIIRRSFSGPELGLPTAIYIAGQNAGPALGALLGATLIDRLGWRAMFAITGMGALVWLPFWWWLAPRDERRTTANAKATVQPVKWAALLRSRAFWGMSGCIFLASYYWYFLLTWVPTYLTMSRGFSTLEMGRIMSVPLFAMAVLNIAGAVVADRLAARLGVFRVRLLFAVGAYVCSACVLLLLVVSSRAAVFPILLVSICTTGMGNSNFWAISQHAPPAYMVGRTIGYLNTISQAAGAAAPLITGLILGPQKQFGPAIFIAGVCPILAAGCLIYAGSKGLERVKSLLADPLDLNV